MTANERQVGGDHYKRPYQHWDLMGDLETPYFPGQVTKYTERHAKKNGRQDLEKAVHFAEKWNEINMSSEMYSLYELSTQDVELVSAYCLDSGLSDIQTQIYFVALLEPRNTELLVSLCRAHLEREYPDKVASAAPVQAELKDGDKVYVVGHTGKARVVGQPSGGAVTVKFENGYDGRFPLHQVYPSRDAVAMKPKTPEDGGHHAIETRGDGNQS